MTLADDRKALQGERERIIQSGRIEDRPKPIPGKKFTVGNFYMHEGGRYIGIIAEIETYRWGKMLVVEEADATGHLTSMIESATMPEATLEWTEIGKDEWMTNFKYVSCDGCDKFFKMGEQYVEGPEGTYHPGCYGTLIGKDVKPDAIQIVSR